jgi:hypothetical protein
VTLFSHIVMARLRVWRWAVPMLLLILVVLYEFGPARWILEIYGAAVHFVAEVIVFGTIGPVLAFLVLDYLSRWLAERETSELQAKLLADAHRRAEQRFVQNDDGLQKLFAASAVLSSVQERSAELPPEVAAHIDAVQAALGETIQHVYDTRQA